jgi:hypothetical protein
MILDLDPLEVRGLRMALAFGVPDPEPDEIASARAKLEAAEERTEGQRAIIALVSDFTPGIVSAGDVRDGLVDLIEGHHAGKVGAVYVPAAGR